MKKLICLLVVGLACLSASLFAQNPTPPEQKSLVKGGWKGQPLAARHLSDLLPDVVYSQGSGIVPNEYVIVKGNITAWRPDNSYVLTTNEEGADPYSVIVHIDDYAWANVDVEATDNVQIYGIVHFSDLSIEIDAIRVGKEEE
ncbi:hypothetical protein FACS1894200_03740 [Spirochaetia bacterium]|nr:hypothetical protein FACS1894200_03740 [Spirochaetia bacterium]